MVNWRSATGTMVSIFVESRVSATVPPYPEACFHDGWIDHKFRLEVISHLTEEPVQWYCGVGRSEYGDSNS